MAWRKREFILWSSILYLLCGQVFMKSTFANTDLDNKSTWKASSEGIILKQDHETSLIYSTPTVLLDDDSEAIPTIAPTFSPTKRPRRPPQPIPPPKDHKEMILFGGVGVLVASLVLFALSFAFKATKKKLEDMMKRRKAPRKPSEQEGGLEAEKESKTPPIIEDLEEGATGGQDLASLPVAEIVYKSTLNRREKETWGATQHQPEVLKNELALNDSSLPGGYVKVVNPDSGSEILMKNEARVLRRSSFPSYRHLNEQFLMNSLSRFNALQSDQVLLKQNETGRMAVNAGQQGEDASTHSNSKELQDSDICHAVNSSSSTEIQIE